MAQARKHEIIPVAIVDSTDVGPVPLYLFYLACFSFMQKKEGLCVCMHVPFQRLYKLNDVHQAYYICLFPTFGNMLLCCFLLHSD
jgi:hypothetical protein